MSDGMRNPLPGGPIVLIGLMGVGKTTVGRRLARALGARFADSDAAVVEAAGLSIEAIFEQFGEPTFREYERRAIARLLEAEPGVVATGGGAFIDPQTRALIKRSATSVWLRAPLAVLLRRTRGGGRPLLKSGDRRAILERLIAERYPVYAEADITVDTRGEPPDATVARVRDALEIYRAETPA